MLYILNCTILHVNSISIKQKQKRSEPRCSRNLLGKIKKKKVIKTDPDMKLEEKDFTISMSVGQQDSSHLQAKERGFRINQTCQHLDLGLLASRS